MYKNLGVHRPLGGTDKYRTLLKPDSQFLGKNKSILVKDDTITQAQVILPPRYIKYFLF